MQFTTFLFALLPAAVLAVGESCTTPYGAGTCLNTSSSCSGSFYSGYCPGAANIQCCVPKAGETCSTPRGNGVCKNTASGCSGTFVPGYCSGGSTNVCCVANPSGGGSVSGEAILNAAKTQAGVWYSWGGGGCNGKSKGIDSGANTVGFDCSGLTQYAVCQATGKSVVIPRTTRGQYAVGKRIPLAQRKPGDLIYYATGGDCSCSGGNCPKMYHVAIEAGNGKMFEAQKTGTQVGLHNYRSYEVCPYVIRHW